MEIQYYERREKSNKVFTYMNSMFCKIIKVSGNTIIYVNLPTLDIEYKNTEKINYFKVFFQINEYNNIIENALDLANATRMRRITSDKHFYKLTIRQFNKIYKRIDLQEFKVDKNISDNEYLKNNDYKLYIFWNRENNDVDYIDKNEILKTRKTLKNSLENVKK
jgi:hypothetical protein